MTAQANSAEPQTSRTVMIETNPAVKISCKYPFVKFLKNQTSTTNLPKSHSASLINRPASWACW
ncbi:hypothetical protein RP20_CCG000277 [Aedes albopictus]|nr:hypothetical protein RP20_CCG000277 [Aedes albopictus]